MQYASELCLLLIQAFDQLLKLQATYIELAVSFT